MASVALENVTKTFPGGIQAVKGVSLAVADGQFVVLVGPSGCGKSTTLRLVAGLEDLSSGDIRIGERIVNTVHPKDRDIAMVFQNYALYPHMTAYQNMSFALRLRKVPRKEIDRRVREAARTLGIEELLSRRPKALSGGQRQRVAVGRAIVREPKAFLFDEPLSNLDAKLRVATRAELKALHQRLKTTTLYVTHDQEEAMTLGDRIVVMSAGLVQQDGPPLEVYRRPVNRFVASFIGTPAMNFLDGALDGGVFVERGEKGARLPVPAAASLAAHAGKPVVLGIRPQAFRDARAGAAPGISLTVEVVEPLGDQMDIHGQTAAGSRLVARLAARPGVEPGARLLLETEPAGVHLFEPGEYGKNLLL